jgi:DNA-binding response OmpR family regulator
MATVLVVEHDKNQRLLLEEELGYEGYTAVTASNAEEAIAALSQAKVDLVVLDMHLPGMGGSEFLGRLAGLGERPPVVIHTADESCRDGFVSRLAEAFVLKHSDLSELVETIRGLLCRASGQPVVPPAPAMA